MENRSRRSVKYRTAELNLPTDFTEAPTAVLLRCSQPFIGVSSARFIMRPTGRDAQRAPTAAEGPWLVALTAGLIRHRPLSHRSRYQHNIALVRMSVASHVANLYS